MRLLQISVFVLFLEAEAKEKRSREDVNTKQQVRAYGYNAKDDRIKRITKSFGKDSSSRPGVTKRQFMYPAYGDPNYPILKPPPIHHFVVHHHASKLNPYCFYLMIFFNMQLYGHRKCIIHRHL